MIEEPYRWLEAIAHRREYVRDQIRTATPVLAMSLPEGVLMVAAGTGQSKVFEIFDRHIGGAFGHPADVERLRQAAIDAAHVEGFTRAAEDVTLRRLVGFGLGPLVKSQFEHVYGAPILAEWLFAEAGTSPAEDVLMRLHFHGAFRMCDGGVGVAAPDPDKERLAEQWIREEAPGRRGLEAASRLLLQAWWLLEAGKPLGTGRPDEGAREEGWRQATRDKVLELALLERASTRRSKVRWLTPGEAGLA
ncbi:MAG: hypothetical protein FJ404_11645 [Verrucomicrobia bacterium]|nr:hypothetical protein [Verrucomicrobiota bacterium]